MKKNTAWTVIAVALAVIVAWWLVDVVFSLVWMLVKIALVAVVAVAVYLGVKAATRNIRD